MKHHFKKLAACLALLVLASPAHAAVDSGDTAWIMVSTALVLLMTPGLAFFYAGMVRGKSAVSTLYQNLITIGVIGILWITVGFSLAFVGDVKGFIGSTDALFLKGVGQEPDGDSTIPYIVFAAFQMMFAIITPALMTGAFAERVKFKSWIAILILWSLVVYAPVCHWVWGSGGWLAEKGALDFAGGLVVHMTAGYSALVAAIVFGKRRDFGGNIKAYDTGYIVLGTALLWFGWFGFNAGSALGSNGLAGHAFMTTFASAAAAFLAWTLLDKIKDGKPTAMGGCIGIVAGLVAVTPAAGFVTLSTALMIGVLAGILCNLAARIVKGKFKIDDSLDVFACHGVGGTLGVIVTGLLASKAVNPDAADGLLNGGDALLNANLTGAVAVAGYSMIATFVIIKLVGAVFGLRVSDSEENSGLDGSQHGEKINNG